MINRICVVQKINVIVKLNFLNSTHFESRVNQSFLSSGELNTAT